MIKLFEDFIGKVILYHGSNVSNPNRFNKLKRILFLSSDIDFSCDYGRNLFQITINPKKIFDSTIQENMKDIFIMSIKKNGYIRDNEFEMIFNKPMYFNSVGDLIDRRLDKTYKNFRYHNSWWIIEKFIKEFGIEFFELKGYDSIKITERGVENYIIWSDGIIVDVKKINKNR